MDKAVLVEVLAEAAGKRPKNASFEFSEQEGASVLVSTDGPLFVIEEVSRVEVKEGFAAVRAGKNDLYLVELTRVIGLRVHRARREGAGFTTV